MSKNEGIVVEVMLVDVVVVVVDVDVDVLVVVEVVVVVDVVVTVVDVVVVDEVEDVLETVDEVVELDVDDTVLLVVVAHGQSRLTPRPIAALRHRNASVAVVTALPPGRQMHSGLQVSKPIATRRMKRQSVAVGSAPEVTG